MEQIPQHNVFRFGDLEISSQFDSGNVQRVEQAEKDWFQLWTGADCALTPVQGSCRTWFYFRVTAKALRLLKFTLKNLNNQSRLFLEGMKPVFLTGGSEWKRIESKIEFQTVSEQFEITFSHTCGATPTYFAFTYPWSLIENRLFLQFIQKSCKDSNIFCCLENLIYTLDGRPCEILTISSKTHVRDKKEKSFVGLYPDGGVRCNKFFNKQVVFITARVHPGEVQSSHVLNGFLRFLISTDKRADLLRNTFIFKIVSILNPDGVFRGFYRTDTNGENLNRFYKNPSLTAHPTIFAVKQLIKYYQSTYTISLYLDLHGHASKKGCFLYGNYMDFKDQIETCLFAKLLQLNCANFDLDACNFTEVNMRSVDKQDGLSKEGSGRVSFFKEFGIVRCYTLECNYNTGKVVNKIEKMQGEVDDEDYCEGPSKYDTRVFEDVGKAVAVALLDLERANPISRVRCFDDVRLEVAGYVGNLVPFRYDPAIRKACKNLYDLECYLEELKKEKKIIRREIHLNSRNQLDKFRGKTKAVKFCKEDLKKTQEMRRKDSTGNLIRAQETLLPYMKKNTFLPQIKAASTQRGKSLNRHFAKLL